MYSVLVGNSKEMKKAKGVNKAVVIHEIKHSNYLDSLKNETIYTHQMKAIRSSKHKIYTTEQGKKSLATYVNKQYLMNDSINALPCEHYKIGFLISEEIFISEDIKLLIGIQTNETMLFYNY